MYSTYLGKETSELESVLKIKIGHLKQCFIHLISFWYFSYTIVAIERKYFTVGNMLCVGAWQELLQKYSTDVYLL